MSVELINRTVCNVALDVFEGPLDLLLYLIKKNDMDIYDIKISQITSDYASYIEIIAEVDLENAGEFLVMTSTLMQIKARLLLPKNTDGQDEEEDPRVELVDRLLEYQRYKEAAQFLDYRAQKAKDTFYRPLPAFASEDYSVTASIWDLLKNFQEALQTAKTKVQEIVYEEDPIEVKMERIMELFQTAGAVTFNSLLYAQKTKAGMIAVFLALLELIRLSKVMARQSDRFGEIIINPITDGSR